MSRQRCVYGRMFVCLFVGLKPEAVRRFWDCFVLYDRINRHEVKSEWSWKRVTALVTNVVPERKRRWDKTSDTA